MPDDGRTGGTANCDLLNTNDSPKFRRGDLKMPDRMGKGGGREREAA
jgi:hypothetical protein